MKVYQWQLNWISANELEVQMQSYPHLQRGLTFEPLLCNQQKKDGYAKEKETGAL